MVVLMYWGSSLCDGKKVHIYLLSLSSYLCTYQDNSISWPVQPQAFTLCSPEIIEKLGVF